MLIVTGRGSNIITELELLLPADEEVERVKANISPPMDADKYVLCAGRMTGKNGKHITEADREDADETWHVNAFWPIRMCEQILEQNERARICVVGSESANTWSYDGAYAAAKVALHKYVETKRVLYPEQQIVCVAPTVIGDTGMTERREDGEALKARQLAHPKMRFLLANEVAAVIHFLLYIERGYISSTVIRMNGGEHAR